MAKDMRISRSGKYPVSPERVAQKVENRERHRASAAMARLEHLLEARGPVDESGETPLREAAVILLWELEKQVYGKKMTSPNLKLRKWKRVKPELTVVKGWGSKGPVMGGDG